ncbi:hypothetical protein FRUB_08453 [Fimbriiglobus ruber]|uniref:Uncharacterized protein n=1 Tax=Fimbriiglobus ruber TaxID=1908690 RepID=A0A225D2S3_9BACT|nr:hypothetical protein FRUB_08453 [Fimbriiglobus ruber]
MLTAAIPTRSRPGSVRPKVIVGTDRAAIIHFLYSTTAVREASVFPAMKATARK